MRCSIGVRVAFGVCPTGKDSAENSNLTHLPEAIVLSVLPDSHVLTRLTDSIYVHTWYRRIELGD